MRVGKYVLTINKYVLYYSPIKMELFGENEQTKLCRLGKWLPEKTTIYKTIDNGGISYFVTVIPDQKKLMVEQVYDKKERKDYSTPKGPYDFSSFSSSDSISFSDEESYSSEISDEDLEGMVENDLTKGFFMQVSFIQLFIGESPRSEYEHEKETGNSFLALISQKEGEYVYIFIGEDIREFTFKYPIVYFISRLGGSWTMYPMAIDLEGHEYALTYNQQSVWDPYQREFSKVQNIPSVRIVAKREAGGSYEKHESGYLVPISRKIQL